MKTEFTPIAMRCTKKQFKAIEPKLNKVNKRLTLFDFGEEYLTNNLDGIDFRFGTTWEKDKGRHKRKVYETWDEATFLKACGIEVDTYTVSKDFILEAHKDACSTWKTKIENQFPELFPKGELEVGKWYVAYYYDVKYVVCVESIGQDINTHGFNITESGRYTDLPFSIHYDYKWTLATKEEVETALIAEAKKRGFKNGVSINNSNLGFIDFAQKTSGYKLSWDGLYLNFGDKNWAIFKNGKWAEIISESIELSLDEIAEKFGVDVSLIKIKK